MTKIKCDKCEHEWETKSTHLYVSCPSCLRKIKNKEKEVKENGKDNSISSETISQTKE